MNKHCSFFRAFLLLLFTIICFGLYSQEQLSNLPTFYIDTENSAPVISKVNYVPGTLTVMSSVETERLTSVATEIRGRGNSTWNMAKKPFRIKLGKKTNLLGLPAKEKSWVLLANYADKTLIRNALAMKISQLAGLEFTPSVRFVDVVLNGNFLGNYMLTDQVQVKKYRVPVEEQLETATQLPDISGGYLLEIDGFATTEPLWFTTPKGLKVTIKYPDDEDINTAQKNYITNYIRTFENLLFSANFDDPEKGYRPMVDTASIINWYIGCELSGNSDSFWSTYIYKKYDDDKIYFGPMWDYDIAFNNDNRLGDAARKLMRNTAHAPRTWIERLWKDEWFRNAVNKRWKELIAGGIENILIDYITELSKELDASQKLNFEKWNNLGQRVYREQVLFSTYEEGTDYLKKYIRDRIAFLTESFANSAPVIPSGPFVADNFYYMIMNKKTNNVIAVDDNSTFMNARLSLWEPDRNNDSHLWMIAATDDNLFRIINKNSGLAMASGGYSNALKQVEVDESDTSQKWSIEPVHTGNIYGIVNPVNGYSVNNEGGRYTNGNPVIEWNNTIDQEEKTNQHWYFQKIEEIPPNSINFSALKFITAIVDGGKVHVYNLPVNSKINVVNMQGQTVVSETGISGDIGFTLPVNGVYILHYVSGEKNGSQKIIYKK